MVLYFIKYVYKTPIGKLLHIQESVRVQRIRPGHPRYVTLRT